MELFAIRHRFGDRVEMETGGAAQIDEFVSVRGGPRRGQTRLFANRNAARAALGEMMADTIIEEQDEIDIAVDGVTIQHGDTLFTEFTLAVMFVEQKEVPLPSSSKP